MILCSFCSFHIQNSDLRSLHGKGRVLVFPRLICRFILKGEGVPAFSGLFWKLSIYLYILRCRYANEVRTMASVRGVVSSLPPRRGGQLGRNLAQWVSTPIILGTTEPLFRIFFSFTRKSTPSLCPPSFYYVVPSAVVDERFDRVRLRGGSVRSDDEEDFALIYRGECFFLF